MLINKRLLQNSIEKFSFPTGEKRNKIDEIISAWQRAFKDHDLSKAKETSLQGKFFAKFFCEILGYTMQDEGFEEWTLKQEAKTEVDGKEADGSLGFYTKCTQQTRCVIELKDAQCNLDSKQQSRESKQTPVEQAFQYLYKFDGCDWVIVSNFRTTRLYHKSKGQTAFEEFNVLTLHEEKEFKRFYFCLCRENLIEKSANSTMDTLIKQSGAQDVDITKEFYADFKRIRKIMFEHICENNVDYDKKLLLEKTQKLLDRFIFVFFCEDTAGLLPHNTVENIYKMAQNSFSMSPCRIWEQFRGLFLAIDKGNSNVSPPINAYNGGLFAYDEILDKLVIKDEMFEHIKKLAHYDFESDLNENILGHIFEQSLSDLEQLKNEIDGVVEDKKQSKRKKDGIFYTPEYITNYIVEQTVGRYLDENPDKLSTIKILDPACGSGAFLNQAHKYLRKRHQIAIEEKIANAKYKKTKSGLEVLQTNLMEHTNIAENDRSILLNNIFGVDLNEESVEITKLALWLKTAHPNYKLQNLDENIKCGNSLIDDPEIAGEKAFKWEEQYKDIITNGGFDVIIGNPPYVRVQNLLHKEIDWYKLIKKTAHKRVDISTLFIEEAHKLLNDGGYLGFITSNQFLVTEYGEKIREFLINNFRIIEIIDFGDLPVFQDASTYVSIFILQKNTKTNFDYKKIQNLEQIQNIQNIESIRIDIKNLSNDIWVLTNKEKLNLIDKLSNKRKLKEIGKAWAGIITGLDDVLLIDEKDVEEHNLEKESILPILRGGDPSRYGDIKPSKYVIYPYRFTNNKTTALEEAELKTKYPNVYKYLLKNKILLQKRKDSRKTFENRLDWFSLIRFGHKSVFNSNKIVTSGEVKKHKFTIDKTLSGFSCARVFAITIDEKICSNLYVLSCLNSKTVQYYLQSFAPLKQGGYYSYSSNILSEAPIPQATQEQQQSLADKAGAMIEMNKNLHEQTQKALELINTEYKPKKMSKNLEKFYTLGLNPFIEELEKQGIKLTLSQKEELIDWYKAKSEMLNNLKSQIDNLDKEIDKEVYNLYGLTDDEIKIIEEG